jgi:hypothetical protein
MAVLVITTNIPGPPDAERPDMYDRVTAEIEAENTAIDGLIIHTAGYLDGEWTVTDVWESAEAHQKFRDERLFPAIKKVSGMDPAGGPQATVKVHELHNYIKP